MFDAFLKSIKGTRKMSLNHWRYQLLHWCFCVKDPNESPLPKSLYKHYCPLFHLTNLLALLLPLIVLIRLTIFLFMLFLDLLELIGGSAAWIGNKLCDFSGYVHSAIHTEPTPEQIKQSQIQTFIFKLRSLCFERDEIPNILASYALDQITLHEAKEIWERLYPVSVQSNNSQSSIQEKNYATMVFWVNFSRIFFKILLNIAYVAVAAFAIRIAYLYGWFLLYFLARIAYILLMLFVKTQIIYYAFLAFCSIAGIAVIWFLCVESFQFVTSRKIYTFREVFLPPLALTKKISLAFSKYCYRQICMVFEFVSMFYNENCPPIQIVSETEEAMTDPDFGKNTAA